MSSILRIQLLGSVRITHEGLAQNTKLSRSIQALLGFLVVYRHRSHPRETLAGTFWGDQDEPRARSCLSTALWRLRRVLEPPGIASGTYLIVSNTGEVSFNRDSPCLLDVAMFEDRTARILARSSDNWGLATATELEEALMSYSGDLLEGFFEDWALRERERLRRMYLTSLASLMHYYKRRGAYDASIECGLKILQQDPLREEIHRELIRLHMASGERAQALRQYNTCREVLQTELGVPPMEETQALYSQISTTAGPQAVQPAYTRELTSLKEALDQLHATLEAMDDACTRFREAVRLIEETIYTPDHPRVYPQNRRTIASSELNYLDLESSVTIR